MLCSVHRGELEANYSSQIKELKLYNFDVIQTFGIFKVADTKSMTWSPSMKHKIVWTQIASYLMK